MICLFKQSTRAQKSGTPIGQDRIQALVRLYDTLSANRTKQALKDVPVNIDAITSDFMEDLGLNTADEVTKFVANVYAALECGVSTYDSSVAGLGGCPYAKFLTLNSGSESVSLAGRIADTNTKLMTDPGGRHAGKRVKRIAMKGAFHGRTELPCLYSDSSKKAYAENLASWKHHENQLITIEPYSIEGLKQAFADADANGWYIEAMFLEPVMGEGDPGRAVPPEDRKSVV